MSDDYNQADTTHTYPSKEALWEDLRSLFAQFNLDTAAARYFVQHICSPYNPRFDAPYRTKVTARSDGQRWVEPYRERLMQCASIYLRLTDKQRQLIHGGAEEGVTWRGEPIDQYLDVVAQTMEMREIGLEAYKREKQPLLRLAKVRV